MQAVLSNATKKSSTLRKEVIPPRRTEGYKIRRKDRSQSWSPTRAHNRDRSPPRKKSHFGWSCPGSSQKTAKNGDYKSRGRGNRSIGKSPRQFYLTKTERRNESSIFSSRSLTLPLINHYLINEIVLFSGFEFCWQHSYDRSTLNLCWCCILHLPAQLPPSRPSPPWPGSPPTRTLPRSCRSGQGDE